MKEIKGNYPRFLALCVGILMFCAQLGFAQFDPIFAASVNRGPIGWDVYRDPLAAAVLPFGVHLHQSASTDPRGLNEDNYHCQRILSQDACLLATAKGAGEIDSIWTTRHDDLGHTGDLTVILDGVTVLHAPLIDIVQGKLGAPFIYPIVADAQQSSGGNYIIAPMTYHSSMQIFTENDPEYYHVTYRSFDDPENVPTFNPQNKAQDVIHHLLAPAQDTPLQKNFVVNPHATEVIGEATGEGVLRQWNVSIPRLGTLTSARLEEITQKISIVIRVNGVITVDVPFREFFGAAAGDFPVRALMFRSPAQAGGSYISLWPMPFSSNISISLVNHSTEIIHGNTGMSLTYDNAIGSRLAQNHIGFFRIDSTGGNAVNGQDFQFFRANGRGKFLGFITQMRGNANHAYLEGNEHIAYNGSAIPQINGTGTEDFMEAGWYFVYGPFSNPLNGETFHGINGNGCSHAAECISAYRIFLPDALSFEHGLTAALQHGPMDNVFAHYNFMNFWYSPQP